MNYNSICCYDYETGSANPHTCSIVQIAAEMIHSRQLRVVDKFSSYVRPDWDSEGITEDSLKFHAKNKGITVQAFKDKLNEFPPIEVVWPQFTAWVDKANYAKGHKNTFCAPISAGYNIIGFDNIITSRHCYEFGPTEKDKFRGENRPRLFSGVYSIDLLHHLWFWFENQKEPKNLKLTTMLEHMGVPEDIIAQAHEAAFDVEWCTKILIRLMKTQRWMTAWREEAQKRRLEFEDCFVGEFK